jgi:hypothetical protein
MFPTTARIRVSFDELRRGCIRVLLTILPLCNRLGIAPLPKLNNIDVDRLKTARLSDDPWSKQVKALYGYVNDQKSATFSSVGSWEFERGT